MKLDFCLEKGCAELTRDAFCKKHTKAEWTMEQHTYVEPYGTRRKRPKKPRKPVICVETGQVFSSATEAAAAMKRSPTSIHTAISSRTLSAGFHFRWESDKQPFIAKPKIERETPRKPVVCVETGQIFSSTKEAANAIHREISGLRDAIREQRKCAGLHFRFVDKLNIEEPQNGKI